jgi:D-lactate dehydrogenase
LYANFDAQLDKFLQENFPHRESHSSLGSTFLNPTTAAGVAFGSGGTQCRKGPAYTERALYLKVVTNKWKEKKIQVVNTLGVEGFEDPIERPPNRQRKRMDSIAYKVDTWGQWIKNGYVQDMRYSNDNVSQKASDTGYAAKLCRHDSSSVSRFNADTSGPDVNRSEGKVIILATVHDTFPKPSARKTFWISFDSLETALKFRKDVCLKEPAELPISIEYLDRDAFDVIDQSGRLLGTVIKIVGVSSSIVRTFWNMKLWVEALPFDGAEVLADKIAFTINPIFPALLPSKVMEAGRSMHHHVVMEVGEFGNGNMQRLLDRMHSFAETHGTGKVLVQECPSKSAKAFRFAAAPAFRTWCVSEGKQGISVDYALPKNGGSTPPLHADEKEAPQPVKRMRYSHFGCNVVHEDLAYEPGVDVEIAKHVLKESVEHQCNGKLPAEHGHGTEYKAPKDTQERWKQMDPLNVLNPGVGGLSEHYCYKEET